MKIATLRVRDSVSEALATLAAWMPRAIGVLAVLLVAVVFGIVSTIFPLLLLIPLVAGPIYFFILWVWPAVGLLLYFCAVLLAPDLKLADVITVATLTLLCLRHLTSPCKGESIPRDIAVPLWLILALSLVSLMAGWFYFHNSVPYMYRDGRVLLYWLFVPVLLLLRADGYISSTQTRHIIVAAASVVSALAVFQAITGIQVVAVGRVVDLETGGVVQSGVTRVQIPGLIFSTLALTYLCVATAAGRLRIIWSAIFCAMFVVALYVNFGRGVWIWSFLSILLTTLFIPKSVSVKLIAALLVVGSVAIGGTYILKPALVERAVDRIASVSQEGGRSSSYGWRKLENHDASLRIAHSPLLGVGLGGEYRNWIAEIRLFEEHTRFIHNSYYFYALKIGVPAALVLLWLLGAVWVRAVRASRPNSASEIDAFSASVAATLPCFCGLNISQPELAGPFGAIYVALVLCAIEYKARDSAMQVGDSGLARAPQPISSTDRQ